MMNCPFCGNPMEDGFLQGNRGAAFVKQYRWWTFDEQDGDVRIPDSLIKGVYVPARYCAHCKKITISLEKEEKSV